VATRRRRLAAVRDRLLAPRTEEATRRWAKCMRFARPSSLRRRCISSAPARDSPSRERLTPTAAGTSDAPHEPGPLQRARRRRGAARARLTANALIMYIVAPRRPSVPGGELLSRAALAAVLCIQKFESDPIWAGAFAEWEGLVVSQGVPAGPPDRASACPDARPLRIRRSAVLPATSALDGRARALAAAGAHRRSA
jgi:hypothetical protein